MPYHDNPAHRTVLMRAEADMQNAIAAVKTGGESVMTPWPGPLGTGTTPINGSERFIRAANIAKARAELASAIAQGLSTSIYVQTLQALGTGGV